MIGDRKTPKVVLQNAYRMAVQKSLVLFFPVTQSAAERLVNAWWLRIEKTSSMKSAVFLHREPLQRAAALCELPEPNLSKTAFEEYRQMLQSSLKAAQRIYGSKESQVQPKSKAAKSVHPLIAAKRNSSQNKKRQLAA